MSEAYDLYQLGRARLREGLAAQATVPLEKARRLEPDKASIREALGIAYFRITDWPSAEREFRKVLELSPWTTTRTTPSAARCSGRGGAARRRRTSSWRASSSRAIPTPGCRRRVTRLRHGSSRSASSVA